MMNDKPEPVTYWYGVRVIIDMVRETGLEPAHLSAQEPKSCMSAIPSLAHIKLVVLSFERHV